MCFESATDVGVLSPGVNSDERPGSCDRGVRKAVRGTMYVLLSLMVVQMEVPSHSRGGSVNGEERRWD